MNLNDYWDEYGLWLEAQGLHDREAPVEDEMWIGHPDEWSSGSMLEPPPNFVGEHWEADFAPRYATNLFWHPELSRW